MLKPSMPGSRPFGEPNAAPVRQTRKLLDARIARRLLRARAQREGGAQRSRGASWRAPGVLPIGLPSAVAALSSKPPLPPLRSGAKVTVSVSPAFTVAGRQPKLYR